MTPQVQQLKSILKNANVTYCGRTPTVRVSKRYLCHIGEKPVYELGRAKSIASDLSSSQIDALELQGAEVDNFINDLYFISR